MSRVRRLTAAVQAALFLCAPLAAQAQQGAAPEARVIVKLKSDSRLAVRKRLAPAEERSERAQALGARIGLAMRAGPPLSEHAQVVFATG